MVPIGSIPWIPEKSIEGNEKGYEEKGDEGCHREDTDENHESHEGIERDEGCFCFFMLLSLSFASLGRAWRAPGGARLGRAWRAPGVSTQALGGGGRHAPGSRVGQLAATRAAEREAGRDLGFSQGYVVGWEEGREAGLKEQLLEGSHYLPSQEGAVRRSFQGGFAALGALPLRG